MKTIFRILIILFLAAVISAGFYYAVNQAPTTSIPAGEGQQFPALTNPGGDGRQLPAMNDSGGQTAGLRPDHRGGGERDGASAGFGLLAVLATLAKLAGITAVILLIDSGINLFRRKHAAYPA
jgi:hypothetical protein